MECDIHLGDDTCDSNYNHAISSVSWSTAQAYGGGHIPVNVTSKFHTSLSSANILRPLSTVDTICN